MGKIEDLEKLQHLKETGALTEEEFEKEKKSILNGNSNNITNQETKLQENKKITKEQGKVIIHSYEEVYIGNPDVKVYIGDNLITSLAKGQTYEYPITETTKITFKSSIRTTSVTVKPNITTEIRLIWNRATGKLETICNEQTSDEVNNTINKQIYQNELNSKKEFDRVWIAIAIILACIVMGFLLWNAYEGWNKASERNSKTVNSSQSSTTLTMDKFNKINIGMTYSQVVNILGFEGKLFSDAGTFKVYTWSNGTTVISISFNNNKVAAKSQVGL